jgi:hypothetical protein
MRGQANDQRLCAESPHLCNRQIVKAKVNAICICSYCDVGAVVYYS